MNFQLGPGGLRGFNNTIRYAKLQQWGKVADEMLDSKWAKKDTPKRARQLSDIVRRYA